MFTNFFSMYGMCVHLTLQCTHLKKERKKNTDFFFSLLVWLHSNGKVSSSLSFIWMSVCCKICKLTMLWADFIMYSLLLLFFFFSILFFSDLAFYRFLFLLFQTLSSTKRRKKSISFILAFALDFLQSGSRLQNWFSIFRSNLNKYVVMWERNVCNQKNSNRKKENIYVCTRHIENKEIIFRKCRIHMIRIMFSSILFFFSSFNLF